MKFGEKTVNFLVFIYLVVIFFNGILTKIMYPMGLISIKKIIPEIILLLLSIVIVIRILKSGIIKNNVFLLIIIFIIISLFIQLFNFSEGEIIYAIRDNVFPFILLFLFYNFKQSQKGNKQLIYITKKIMKIFLISGLILACMQFIYGWEWTSKFYSGYSYYGRDESTGIMIWQIGSLLRIPSVTGDSVIFAMCNLFAYLFIDFINEKKIYKIIAIINILFSTSRTILIVLILYCIIKYLMIIGNKNSKKKKNFYLYGMFSACSVSIGMIIIYALGDSYFFESLFERINGVWANVFKNISINNILIGKGMFNVGTGMSSNLALNSEYYYTFSFVDNTYIYILLCFGIVGVILYILINLKLIKICRVNKNFKYMSFIISSMIGALTINYMQGRGYIFLFAIYMLFFKDSNVIKDNTNTNTKLLI